jgi:uncharacterized protein YbjT (DUF2867 family)
MKKYAVIGGSSGTGLQIVKHLSARGSHVRAISRTPPPASDLIEPYIADVTNPSAIAAALNGDFHAVFYTVDIHDSRQSSAIRNVMYQGCINAIAGALKIAIPPRFILLSVIGPERPSWVWWLLNAGKRGMRTNVLDRERALQQSGLDYVICRAPRLTDGDPTNGVGAMPPANKLTMSTSISRADLAHMMIQAADTAPSRSTWDVLSGAGASVPDWLMPASPALEGQIR